MSGTPGLLRRGRRKLHWCREWATDMFWRLLPGADPDIFEERPFELHLELTNLCNANCVFCPYSIQTRPHEFMSEAVFKKAVADFVAIGGGSVGLTPIVGDALIHPQFLEWVRYLRAIPQIDRITLTTNAILLDKHGVEEVLDAGLSRINVSVAGFEEAMYRRVYRNPGYKKVRANVEKLFELNAARKDPVPLFLCIRADRPWDEVRRDPDFQPFLKYQPKIDFIDSFSRSGGLMGALPGSMKQEPPTFQPRRTPCALTYAGLMVLSNGDVQVCICESSVNAPALVVGNIERNSLSEIWRSDVVRALRQSFEDGSLNPNCAKCDYNYQPVQFHSPEMRRRARSSRRRERGEIVRHSKPVTGVWQME